MIQLISAFAFSVRDVSKSFNCLNDLQIQEDYLFDVGETLYDVLFIFIFALFDQPLI